MISTVHQGDALAILRTMPSDSVHCCITSPPYWGLRDYGVEGQIGLEESLDIFLDRLVAVFDEVRRILRPDGTLWVNMGDSYVSRPNGSTGFNSVINGKARQTNAGRASRICKKASSGLKNKDLLGQPWALAFALRSSGWYLRRDIIWHKTNPMPEACKDRPTTAHEYLFLLSKSASYHYDASAISEPVSGTAHSRGKGLSPKALGQAPTGWATNGESRIGIMLNRGQARVKNNPTNRLNAHREKVLDRRNARSVWTLPTHPCKEAHFATFPPRLIEPCILAGCPSGGTVLDPFAGSGTTGIVAIQHRRNFLGIELNPTYADLARRRCNAVNAPRLSRRFYA